MTISSVGGITISSTAAFVPAPTGAGRGLSRLRLVQANSKEAGMSGDTAGASGAAPIGHNSGESVSVPEPPPVSLEKLALLGEQIALVIGAQRAVGMAAGAIGRLQGVQRIKALRSSYLLSTARFCRRNPQADTRLAVLAYITFLSDNPFGTCRLSVTRMSSLFRRSRRAVLDCIDSLEADGLIGAIRKGGSASIYWPVVSPVAVGLNPAAIAPALAPLARDKTGEAAFTSEDAEPEQTGEVAFTGDDNELVKPPSPADTKLVKADAPTGEGGHPPYPSNDPTKKTLSSAHADGVRATEDLFSDGVPLQGGAKPEESRVTGGTCKPAPSTSDIKLAFSLYLETAARCGLPRHERVDPWVPNIKARLREHGLDGWKRVLAKVEASPFLRGEKTSFRADLDWLSGPKNFAKVLSGKYDDQHKPKPKKLTRY